MNLQISPATAPPGYACAQNTLAGFEGPFRERDKERVKGKEEKGGKKLHLRSK